MFSISTQRFSSKLLKQRYLVERLWSSFRKFNGRYGYLFRQYKVSLSGMLNDILTLEQLQWLLPNPSDVGPFHDLETELDRITSCSTDHQQRQWHVSRECLPFRTPVSFPLFPSFELALSFLDFSPSITPRYFLHFAPYIKCIINLQLHNYTLPDNIKSQ